MPRVGTPYPIEVVRSKTANGGDEWNLRVGSLLVLELGVFRDPGRTPASMLPELLRRARAVPK